MMLLILCRLMPRLVTMIDLRTACAPTVESLPLIIVSITMLTHERRESQFGVRVGASEPR